MASTREETDARRASITRAGDVSLIQLIIDQARQVATNQEIALPEALDASTPLFGGDGIFDSLGLVSLVVGVEQNVRETYGATVTLADDRAMSQRHSPFLTIGSLASYARALLDENVPDHA